MRIKKEDTIAIVIDYQEKLMPSIYKIEEVIKNTLILINGLKALGVKLIATQQYPKGLGETLPEIKEALTEFNMFDKLTFSCYMDKDIKKAIDESGKKNVIIMGTEAHICVLQTIIDLKAAGYNVVLVEDCISSRRENDKLIGVKRAEKEGAVIATYESLLFELAEIAGTPEFKAISKLIR